MKELILIQQVHQKSAIFVTVGKGFKFGPYVCNRCHDVMRIPMKLSDIAILNINGADYCGTATGISKSEAINLMQNTDLSEKSEKL